jgi:glycosyltransferase involved in cell wall biosynthesis
MTISTYRCRRIVTGAGGEECSEDRSPRILHLHLTPFRGGAEEHLLSLLTATGHYGFTPLLAAPAPLLEMMAKELAMFGVKSVAIALPSPLNWMRFIAQLAGILKREHIDLVHCHSVIGSLCAISASRLVGSRPIVETCHGREFWREGKSIKGSFWVDRQASRFVDRFIAVSEATAQFLRESKGISGDKIVVIRNGRDLTSLLPPNTLQIAKARAELGVGDEGTVLLLGRLAKEKGHALLLDALKALGSRHPALTAMFAGVGPLETQLKAMCAAAGLADRVRFLGYRRDLQRLLAAADLVVMPSISEGLPLAAIEALAAARPIVASDTGGVPEVVVDGETGLLIPTGDAGALAQAMHRLLVDPGLALRLGTNGRRFVERHFDLRGQIESTMALYRHLTSDTRMRAAGAA